MTPICTTGPSKTVLGTIMIVVGLLVMLWQFPRIWYIDPNPGQDYHWFAEQTNIVHWKYREIPVGKVAESIIQADAIASGVFESTDGRMVHVYSAKRYLKKENEIGLFSHTPDRCWTTLGWAIQQSPPDFLDLEIHGVGLRFERRVFSHGSERMLVYFGAVVGGKPLPYRLDQYHSSGSIVTGDMGSSVRAWRRLTQGRVWGWAWDSFVQRTPMYGPQQFVRISTRVGIDLSPGDHVLQEMLQHWMRPVAYTEELQTWQQRQPPAEVSRLTTDH